MNHIEQTYHIKAPAIKVWQALTDPAKMEAWGAGPATMDARVGGTFGLWGGDIHGTNTKVVPPTLLEQDWYGHDHPERRYTVTFSLKEVDGLTQVHLRHADVPDDESADMEAGWRDYYFDPIKKLLEETAATPN